MFSIGLKQLRKVWVVGVVSAGLICTGNLQAVEPDAMIPPDSEFVLSARPRQLLDSAFLKGQGWDVLLKTVLATNDTVQQILETTGIDPFKDIESFQVASKGQGPEADFMIVVRGKLNQKKISKVVEEQGENSGAPVKKFKEKGVTLWELKTPGPSIYLGFQENKAVLGSNKKENLITCLTEGFRESVNADLRTALEKVDGKEGVWAAGVITEQARKGMDRQDDLRPLADKMESWAVSFDMTDAMKFAIDLYAKDAATARALKDLTENKFFPFLKNRPNRGGEAGKERMEKVMKELKLEAKGKSVSARLSIDAEMLKSLLPQ